MITELKLKIIENDLIQIFPKDKEDLIRYFNILRLLNTVNSKEEYKDLKEDLRILKGGRRKNGK